ncbi:hypothetical protein AMES_7135 [Amycolatopsis mediterranei S699]|uniref:PucR C-terminal helix-turn-helix domain-containing protein n=2 Tax=Amycolatopsis mediterranei TaxID=33910 RepID=A0A0H3DE36_AMYMU|nr:PucR family transcriptional regulator [Amycolatopsis mediterranei]ADJ48961.1 conserved hypothetical protein [Amycolatopsis mediterranei U32]AEK45910.1 hypothetical protein RAM_37215 [Amycolatopsis mediterranei S699]AFO80669.1 hypothetical protein AMES_7135 [Amycolatopsis mediterranei S699]AGT87797.1 hypothetical protein B737_7135 [Amycolatopsis mediterranei RB]KDU93921.1 hypothetical protein DV36_00860 [Amycolatopsis mediterranei]
MSGVSLADLVGALRHDVVRVSIDGDAAQAVRGVELLDPQAGEGYGPGQLLLGVGLDVGARDDTESALRAAAESGGVLAVKSSRELPVAFLDRARAAGVTVVSIDERVPWSRIQRLASAVLATRSGGDAEGATSGGDLFSLANSVAGAVGGAVAIMDTGQAIVAYSNLPDQPIDETRRRGILGRRVPEEALPDHLSGEVWRSDSVVRRQREGDLPRLAVVIRAGEEVLGSLWVAFPGPIPECAATLHQGARLAALHMLALRRHLDADQESRNLAFRAALDHPGDEGPDLRLPAVLLGADVPGPGEIHGANLLRVLDLFGLDGRALGHQPALALSNNRIYALLPAAPAGSIPVPALVAHLRDRVEHTLRSEITVVSSRQVQAVAELRGERHDVDTALDHVRDSGEAPSHYTTEQLRAPIVHKRLVNTIRGDALLRIGIGERILGYDRKHSSEFVATLRGYLRHFGDVVAASAELHIHQNTLRQRLRRAQELFDLDLTDPAQRLLLELELTAAAGN